MGVCGVKGCRRKARVAFDVRNPWPDGKPTDERHYEVCLRCANEFWGPVPESGAWLALGNEGPEDVTVLCADCHQTFHEHRSLER